MDLNLSQRLYSRFLPDDFHEPKTFCWLIVYPIHYFFQISKVKYIMLQSPVTVLHY